MNLFKEIHEIVFHGQGGYNWETIYNMPIWLRKFTANEMKNWYDKVNKSKEQDNIAIDSQGNIKTPEFLQNPVKSNIQSKKSPVVDGNGGKKRVKYQ